MLEIKQKLDLLVEKRNLVPDEFWLDGAFWFHDSQGSSEQYSWGQERLGINKEGKIVWAFDSGCSCNSPWDSFDITKCETASHKEFELKNFMDKRNDSYLTDDEKMIEKNIDEFLLLIRDDVEPKEVVNASNAEIRRFLIKRIGYDKIKADVEATVLHVDGTSELLKFKTGEMYVKVKDSSTDREYLLYVEGNHKTCKSAIAWTFGLQEHEYNPIIES